MKRTIYLGMFLSLIGTMSLLAQTTEETRQLSAFNAVKVSNAIEAEMIKGDRHEVEIIASGIDLDKVETKVANRILEVRIGKSNSRSTSVKVKITYVEIEDISASTSAKIFVKDKIEAKSVKIGASTNSYVEAGVNSQVLLLEAETNAKIFVSGKTRDLELKGFTNAEIKGEDLEVDNAEVRVNTAANARFNVNSSIKGSAGTAGKVYYRGNPSVVDVKTNTGGSIEEEK